MWRNALSRHHTERCRVGAQAVVGSPEDRGRIVFVYFVLEVEARFRKNGKSFKLPVFIGLIARTHGGLPVDRTMIPPLRNALLPHDRKRRPARRIPRASSVLIYVLRPALFSRADFV